ncbi:MAG: xylanase [Tannerellaceae bacterium]|nr:xylanase [Tannerellaceae bacterium]
MKTRLLTFFYFFAVVLFTSCEDDDKKTHEPVPDDTWRTYYVHFNQQNQEIDNFGASDAWTFRHVCKNWTEDKRNQIADLLFSLEKDEDGKPKGIGLSLWRMVFGAGSLEHPYPGREARWNNMPCIRNESGEYDMAPDGAVGGQFWFLKAAKERGCEQFLGFCNSPPYYWTKTGYANAVGDIALQYELNLKDEHLTDYATYLAELVKRTKENHGIDFNYVCPLNEPEWQADGTESCHANNDEIAYVAKAVNAKFQEYGLDTKVVIPESGKPHFVYSNPVGQPNPEKYGNKAEYFFSPASSTNLLNQSNVAKLLATHSYWSVNTDSELKQIREAVGQKVRETGIKYWQTEFCILSDDFDLGTTEDGNATGGGGRDYSMKLALYVARIIHADLVFANASAWHWWLGATPFDYKDGLLYLTDDYYNGDVNIPKLLWGFGNYSRFIRPGAIRLGMSRDKGDTNELKDVMSSAYVNKDGTLVVVMINYSDEEREIKLSFSDDKSRNLIPYITSDKEGDDLKPSEEVKDGDVYILPAKSIVTFAE